MAELVKKILLMLYLFCFEQFVYAQYSDAEVFKQMNPSAQKNASIDSLRKLTLTVKEDTGKVILLWKLSNIYLWSFPDSALIYALQGLQLSKKLNFERGTIKLYHSVAQAFAARGDYPKALEIELKALDLSEKLNDQIQIDLSFFWIGIVYSSFGDAQKALYYFYKLKPDSEVFLKNQELIASQIGACYFNLNKFDSASFYIRRSYDLEISENNNWSGPYFWMASINDKEGNLAESIRFYRKGLSISFAKLDLIDGYTGMAHVFQKEKLFDSSVHYAQQALIEAQNESFLPQTIEASKLLAALYKARYNTDSAFKYEELMLAGTDSLFSQEKIKQMQNLFFSQQLDQQEESNRQEQLQTQIKISILLAALAAFLFIGFLLWRNNRQKQTANILLKQKNEKIENTLHELRATQVQLIQSEKEKLRAHHDREVHELEAKALRAQMNPHFIFNCMNSIKSLMQQKEEDKAVTYLTTFSKLLRTILQNSDQREISLYEEIETCKLYTRLESLRFGNKFSYHFNVDESIDLKSITVPALIIQPFIENAIWHGIMPKEEGGTITVSITNNGEAVLCIIEDDGIGREMSRQNKFKGEPSTHQSKGVHLTQSRLDLDNTLNQRNASVEIIDKKDAEGNGAGTKIVLTFMEF